MAACSLNVIGNNHIWDRDSGFYVYHMIFTNGAVIQVPMFRAWPWSQMGPWFKFLHLTPWPWFRHGCNMCQHVTEDIARYSLGDLFLVVYPYQDLDVPKDELATELGSICYTVPTTDVQHKIIPKGLAKKKNLSVGICVNCWKLKTIKCITCDVFCINIPLNCWNSEKINMKLSNLIF